MVFDGLSLIRLTEDHVIKPFDCGDADLNDFLINESKDYQNQLLAVTYILESETETVAFFSIFNDKITVANCDTKSQWRKLIQSALPFPKRMTSYPAMKIGRLGVSEQYKGKSIGRSILDYTKEWFIDKNKTGCKYITVDAYKDSLGFYEKNKFQFLTKTDEGHDTRLMYYDLIDMTKPDAAPTELVPSQA